MQVVNSGEEWGLCLSSMIIGEYHQKIGIKNRIAFPGKFKKKLNELETVLDKWIYFIKEAENLEMIPKEFESKEEFIEAFQIATQHT